MDYLKELLTKSGGNLSHASRISGRDRSDLCKLLKKYSLERTAFSQEESG
jgi:DNA-binding protein Fis